MSGGRQDGEEGNRKVGLKVEKNENRKADKINTEKVLMNYLQFARDVFIESLES